MWFCSFEEKSHQILLKVYVKCFSQVKWPVHMCSISQIKQKNNSYIYWYNRFNKKEFHYIICEIKSILVIAKLTAVLNFMKNVPACFRSSNCNYQLLFLSSFLLDKLMNFRWWLLPFYNMTAFEIELTQTLLSKNCFSLKLNVN